MCGKRKADMLRMRVCVVSVLMLFVGASGAPPNIEDQATPTDDLLVPPAIHTLPSIKPEEICQRRPLTINFKDLGWNDWIIAPLDYDAGICTGYCVQDLPNATNHAIIQALANKVTDIVPKPCCVPTELEPISVLYLDDFSNVVLRQYKNMKVKGCGCR